MARAALATGLKSGITSWVSHEDPERRRLGQLVAKAKLLDPVMARKLRY